MRVHEFEGAMFEDEIEYYVHYMGRWAVCGQQVLVFFHEVNRSCYAFFVWNVYRDVTSAVTKTTLGGRGGTFSMRLRKRFVYLTCDRRLLARGWMRSVTQAERWSVGPSHPETIGRRGQPGLWILSSPQNRGVRVFLGSSKNSLVALSIMCWKCIYYMRVHLSLIIAHVGLQLSGLYLLRSCRCVWILVRQPLVFIMQMPLPL